MLLLKNRNDLHLLSDLIPAHVYRVILSAVVHEHQLTHNKYLFQMGKGKGNSSTEKLHKYKIWKTEKYKIDIK